MKNLISVLCIAMICLNFYPAESQTTDSFIWAKRGGGSAAHDWGNDVVTDNNNNIYAEHVINRKDYYCLYQNSFGC